MGKWHWILTAGINTSIISFIPTVKFSCHDSSPFMTTFSSQIWRWMKAVMRQIVIQYWRWAFVPAPSELYMTLSSLGSFIPFCVSILCITLLVSKVIQALSWSAQISDFSFSWLQQTETFSKISSRTFGNLPLSQQLWKYQSIGGFFLKAFTENKFFEIQQKRTQIFHFLHLNLGLILSMCYFLAKETVLSPVTFVCTWEE